MLKLRGNTLVPIEDGDHTRGALAIKASPFSS